MFQDYLDLKATLRCRKHIKLGNTREKAEYAMKLEVVLKSAYDQDLEVNLQEIISAEICIDWMYFFVSIKQAQNSYPRTFFVIH